MANLAELEGFDLVNDIINDFTMKNFNIKANPAAEFEAYCETKEIGYTFVYEQDNREYFIKDAEMRFPEIEADIFLWCLLHEIGHVMTNPLWTQEEIDYFCHQKDQCAYIEDDQARHDWYHAIGDEFFATKWAGEYMLAHQQEIIDFWDRFQTALMLFYFKNGLI